MARFELGGPGKPLTPGRPLKAPGICLKTLLVAPVQTRRAQGLDLGLARGSQFPPEDELALLSRPSVSSRRRTCAPVFFFVSSTHVDQAGAMFGWAWLEAFCLEAIKP